MSRTTRQLLVCALLALSGQTFAQTSDPFRDFDQMFEQMRRQMLGSPGGMPADSLWTQRGGQRQFFQMSPDSSSYFYFHVDTSFGGNGSSQFFNFRFGGPQNGTSGSPEIERMFQQMEEMQRQLWGGSPRLQPRGAEPEESEDGLLPEERIRQQEEHSKAQSGSNNPAGTPTTPPAPALAPKPKIRTTRV